MKSKIFSSLLCSAVLASILSLSANDQQETQIYLSEVELQEIFNNPKRSYVYIGKEVSEIAEVIEEISKLDENQESIVVALAEHIAKGFSIGNYDAVAQALEQAEAILRTHADKLSEDRFAALSRSLNNIIEQVIEDRLSLDAELLSFLKDKVNATGDSISITRSGLRLLVINEKMHVHGKSKFYRDVTFTHDVKFEDDVKFKDDVRIEGTLSVADETIGCDLTVGCNINMNDSIDSTIGNIIKNGVPFVHNFGISNTFVGGNAGNFTMAGMNNSGFGVSALTINTLGSDNTAVGVLTLANNTIGLSNTAVGSNALNENTTGNENTAIGLNALGSNTTGFNNVASGANALSNNINGALNTAIGSSALANIATGSSNIGIGAGAGVNYNGGENGNICIDNSGVNGESITTRIGTVQTRTFIAGIRGATTGIANAITVLIDSNGQLGTINSSQNVKHNIQDMGAESANLYNLRPVTFVYNGDASETKQYGLIAEEVDKVFPGIVVYDENGQPQTIQYHVLPALILNELQKLAARVAVLEARS